MEVGLTLLAQASMPLYYWWEAIQTAVYLINRLPSTVLKHKSTFHVLFSKAPDYTTLKPFGCACFPNLRPYNAHKLSFTQPNVYFWDTIVNIKIISVCHQPGEYIYISRHVVFNEDDFPYQQGFIYKRQSEVLIQHLQIEIW